MKRVRRTGTLVLEIPSIIENIGALLLDDS